jgi:uncharacterized protein (DUF169 family)
MSSIEKLVEMGKKVKEDLALRTHPLGIKFYKGKELDEELEKARRPLKNFNIRMPICQLINIARTYGWAVATTLEDSYCILGARVMGLINEVPEYLPEDITRFHAKDKETGKAIWEGLERKCLPLGSTSSILISPLVRMRTEPDVVVMYGTPIQVARLAKAFTWHGIFPETTFIGVAACSSIPKAYLSGKPQLSIPCAGEVFLGRSEEDEMSIAFPAKLMENLVTGLENTKIMFPYPAKFMIYEPRVLSGYRITYKDYEEWKKRKSQ